MDKTSRTNGPGWRALAAAAVVTQGILVTPAPAREKAPPDTDRYMRTLEEPGGSITLQVAARTFAPSAQRGAGGPTVALVGVSHIGEKELYDSIQDMLDGHDVVLYESVKPPGTGGAAGPDDQQRIDATRAAMRFLSTVLVAHHEAAQRYPKCLDELVRFAAERDPRMQQWLTAAREDAWGGGVTYRLEDDGRFVLSSLGGDRRPGGSGVNADLRMTDRDASPEALGWQEDNLQSELAKALGLEFQLDALDYGRPNFRNSDLAMDQLERALRDEGIDFAPLEGTLGGASLPGRIAVFLLRLIRAADVFFDGAIADMLKVMLIELLSDEAVMEQSLRQFGEGFAAVIIGQRNQVVVDQVKAIADSEGGVESIAILYGAAHMPDMGQRLAEQLGYRPTGEQWLTAMEVDVSRSAVSAEQLQQVRRMIRQQLRFMVPPKASREDDDD